MDSSESASLSPTSPERVPGLLEGNREQPPETTTKQKPATRTQQTKHHSREIPFPTFLLSLSLFSPAISSAFRECCSDSQTTLHHRRQFIKDDHVRPVAQGLIRIRMRFQEDSVAAASDGGPRQVRS